jgi:hypothetical protein
MIVKPGRGTRKRRHETNDIGMIEALEDPHLAHTLSSLPFTFFFGIAFSTTSRVMSTGGVTGDVDREVADEDFEEAERWFVE